MFILNYYSNGTPSDTVTVVYSTFEKAKKAFYKFLYYQLSNYEDSSLLDEFLFQLEENEEQEEIIICGGEEGDYFDEIILRKKVEEEKLRIFFQGTFVETDENDANYFKIEVHELKEDGDFIVDGLIGITSQGKVDDKVIDELIEVLTV